MPECLSLLVGGLAFAFFIILYNLIGNERKERERLAHQVATLEHLLAQLRRPAEAPKPHPAGELQQPHSHADGDFGRYAGAPPVPEPPSPPPVRPEPGTVMAAAISDHGQDAQPFLTAAEMEPAGPARPVYPAAHPPVAAAAPPPQVAGLPGPAAPRMAASTAKPAESGVSKPKVNWEIDFATKWLPALGGVLLIVGAAILAMLIDAPFFRVAISYSVAAIVGGGGCWVLRRSETVGRSTIAVGLAIGYFTSWAAHFIPAMNVFHAAISIGLMVVFAGALVALAEKWKSETVAGLGFGLGILAALISASTSDGFSLVALAVIAVAAGVLLVRHEWTRLTAFALFGIYLSTVVLWFLIPIGGAPGEIAANLGALAFYHAVFAVAALKWGRIWLARERLAETAPEEFAVPELKLGTLPYNSAFRLLNSLLFISLAIYLMWLTKTWWVHVHWLLFALALLEGLRVMSPAARLSGLRSFHALLAFTLATAGVVSAFSGLAESTVLAAMTLSIAVAATRAPVLRWFRPLTIVTAGLAVVSFDLGATTPMDFLAMLFPGILLLASALPWEWIWVRKPKPPDSKVLYGIELLSGQFRAMIAAGLLIAAVVDYIDEPLLNYFIPCMIIALVAGMLLLRAWKWFSAAVLLTGLAALAMIDHLDIAKIFEIFWIAAMLYLWGEYARVARHPVTQVISVLASLAAGVMGAVLFGDIIKELDPWMGVVFAVAALGCAAIGLMQNHWPPIPSLVRQPLSEEPRKAILAAGEWDRRNRPGFVTGIILGIAAVAFAMTVDAKTNLFSPGILAGAAFLVWIKYSREKVARPVRVGITYGLALFIMCIAILVHQQFSMEGLLIVTMLCTGSLVIGFVLRSVPVINVALCALFALIFAGAVASTEGGALDAWACALGLVMALLYFVSSRLAARVLQRVGFAERPLNEDSYRISGVVLMLISTAMALLFLSVSDLLPVKLVTASWGVLAALMLAWGMMWIDKPMRYTAFAALLLAVIRLFVVDLAGADKLTQVIAFFILGIILIAAGIAYGFLRKRLGGERQEVQEIETTEPSPHEGNIEGGS